MLKQSHKLLKQATATQFARNNIAKTSQILLNANYCSQQGQGLMTPHRVAYFSTDSKARVDSDFKSAGELRKALVKASLVHARTVGFNDQCIIDACRDHGLPPTSVGILKRGPIEVVDHAMEFWLSEMHRELSSREDLKAMRVRERVSTGIKTRLELVVPYKKVWP